MKEMTYKELIEDNLLKEFGISASDATVDQLYHVFAMTVNDLLVRKRRQYNDIVKAKKGKRVYYLCMEFLMGRSLKNNIYNLGLVKEFTAVAEELGYTLEELYEKEPDAGLGNGGLGRLAACYMDSLSALSYPALGFSLRYEYGLFKQKIIDGWQTELPDVWLPGGEVWLNQRTDRTFTVKFGGWVETQTENGSTRYIYRDYQEVEAVPYDMMISGANSDAVNVLRLWKAQNIKKFDVTSFSQGDYIQAMKEYNEAELICKVLYPSDNHPQGRSLRLKQQYFLVSAAIQNIVKAHLHYHGDINSLPKKVAIHINDTHPALCIPELIRILVDDHDLSFDKAWNIVTKTIAYTNHTVLPEALETWSVELIKSTLPRLYIIIEEINQRFIDIACTMGIKRSEAVNLGIIRNNQVHMANLSVIASHTVNGVSALHSEIIKKSIFQGLYNLKPEKFTNVTNGIAYRRWLCQSNQGLVDLLNRKIGKGYTKDASKLRGLLEFIEDDDVLNELEEIKHKNKCTFANFLYKKTNIIVNPNTRFDVQVKRLHEYKRQLLNVLKIIALLIEIEENPNIEVTPQTFIFGAKAAPGYYAAKEIIQLIVCLSKEIDKHPEVKQKLDVVFIEDYNVSTAEVLMPASEISEQISLAGKEASGTGNMKFMINGAITLGTLDGANVEISEVVGEENIFIFGNKTEEVNALLKEGYNARAYYEKNETIRKVIERLNLGFDNRSFSNISRYLLDNHPFSDPFMCLADFDSYLAAYHKMDEIYKDRRKWNQMSLVNIAEAGIFSSDRSIEEYATRIWNVEKILKDA